MKALIFKEFKLAMHPLIYVFVLLFPFMILIPNYPVCINFIYILAGYPILFLGANKGQQSNDLLYSTLLPVRKKDIVLARLITVTIIQVVSITLCSCLVPLSQLIKSNIVSQDGTGAVAPGLTLDGYLSIIGIILTGFALSDLIFFPIYYKKGKSIVFSSTMAILFFSIYIVIFTVLPAVISGFEWYVNFMCFSGIGNQIIVFSAGLLLYIGIHYLVYRISSKRLEKVDF